MSDLACDLTWRCTRWCLSAGVSSSASPSGGWVTPEQYDETSRRLEKVGDWPPKGLEYHVAFVSDGKFRVSEIWDSREQFDAFGKLLMPVLSDVGIELSGDPEILKIHNVAKR